MSAGESPPRRSDRLQLGSAAGGVPVVTQSKRGKTGLSPPPGPSLSQSFVETTGAKWDPPPSLSLEEDCLGLTPIDWTKTELERGRTIRDDDWVSSPAKTGKLWENMDLLRRAIDLRGVPERPQPMPDGAGPMLIVTVAPPCSGKGSVLETVYRRLGIPSKNSILNADPDDIFYECITEMLGYMPPKTEEGWLGFAEAVAMLPDKKYREPTQDESQHAKLEAKRAFARYEQFIPLSDLTRVNQRPIAPGWACTSRAMKIPIGPQYERLLTMTMDYIFAEAQKRRLNIVLNVTGMSMLKLIDQYIGKAQGYQVVIVGIHSTVADCKARAKDRNSKQHRYMSESLVEDNNYDFQSKGAIFDWEQKSREKGYQYILLENTWIPGKQSSDSDVTLLCDRLRDQTFSPAAPDGTYPGGDPTGSLLNPDGDGVYGMKWDSETGSFNTEERDEVRAKAKDAAKEAKEAKESRRAAAAAAAAERKGAEGGEGGLGGASRKRRLHTNRPRRTMKKYVRRVTRRRGGRGGHHSRRYRRH